ncbi:MAG: DUF58 domain-containing protein [Woeseiaceae bacterium]|nr:DUF58 domain-containing protein [Woeseiaceae bacterium]
MRHDKLPADASPVSVSQKGLIHLAGPARGIALDVLRINSLQAGAYVSRFRGRGMEFDESRPYQPGDDPRNIDWRVTARSTEAYTKLFREERERPVLIMLDLRRSMHFATRGCSNPSMPAARRRCCRGPRITVATGWAASSSATLRTAKLRPRLGRQSALHYLHQLTIHPDWATTDVPAADPAQPLVQAMSALRRVTRPGSLVIVISDFSGFNRAAQSYLSGVARHNEVLAVFLSDPLERRLPPPGQYRLVSNDDELAIDTRSRAARRDYRNAFEQRQAELEQFCQRYAIHLMPLSTADDPIECLQAALGRRMH